MLSSGKEESKLESSLCCWWAFKVGQLLENSWAFHIHSPEDLAIPLHVAIYSREIKIDVHIYTCIVFIAASVIIWKKYKQPKCPSMGKFINKLKLWWQTLKIRQNQELWNHILPLGSVSRFFYLRVSSTSAQQTLKCPSWLWVIIAAIVILIN